MVPLPPFGTHGHFGWTVGYSINVQRAFIASGASATAQPESRVTEPPFVQSPIEDDRPVTVRMRPTGNEEPVPRWLELVERDLPWWTALLS